MIIKPIKTRIFKEGENLFDFVSGYFKRIPEKSVIVVTSKIVALSEGRTAVAENYEAKEKLIRSESDFAIRTEHVWLTLKDGIAMASSGIDESNSENGKLILLPKNSFEAARVLRKKLQEKFKVKDLGVLITDSRTSPLRRGVTGIALGYAGFKGIKEYKGTPDIFGRKFKFSRTNVADSLATASVLVMGEGKERQPLAVIRKASVEFCEKVNPKELKISAQDDMYRPLLSKISKI